jgi:hypothetical protein
MAYCEGLGYDIIVSLTIVNVLHAWNVQNILASKCVASSGTVPQNISRKNGTTSFYSVKPIRTWAVMGEIGIKIG